MKKGRLGAVLACAQLLAASTALSDWSVQGNPLTLSPRSQVGLALIPDGSGGAIAAWVDARQGNTADIYMQHLTASGTRVAGWAPNGDSATKWICHRDTIAMVPDGAGGALLAWSENRCTTWNDIYALRITPSGDLASGWQVNGTPVCLVSDDDKRVPSIAGDESGGAFVAWQDRRNLWPREVYLSHLTATGGVAPGWPMGDGLRVCNVNSDQLADVVAPDGAGGAFVVWQDRRSGNDIYLQHFLGDGSLMPGWSATGLPVCTAPGDQQAPAMLADGAGGVFIAWVDHRDGTDNIYAVRMTGAGAVAPGWIGGGTPVCAAPGDQQAPAIALDGSGGVLVTWQDRRGGAFDVYGQRMDGQGLLAPGWPAFGVPLCQATGDQTSPQLAPDAAGGAFVVWQDGRSGDHVYGQHVTGSGALFPGWPAGGLALCAAPGGQRNSLIVGDGAGGAIAAWVDNRTCATTAEDIYAIRTGPAGPVAATVNHLAAEHHTGQTFLTWDCPSGEGWTYRVYASPLPISQASDLDAATYLGTVCDSTWYDRRLSVLTATECHYSTDSLAAPLGPTQGVFVVTPETSGSTYYAVTAQQGSCVENRAVAPGVNALVAAVAESGDAPEPVYQRTLSIDSQLVADVYTLWTSDRPSSASAATANRPGLAYDCAVVRGGPPPQNSLVFALHVRNGNFLQGAYSGTGYPGEWILALDDPIPTEDVNTYWYGYHENYDLARWTNPVPTSGVVRDYTQQRVLRTLLWARHHFQIDTTRVYSVSFSIAGIGSFRVALRRPDLIAAEMTMVSGFNLGYLNDPNPQCSWNPGRWLRVSADRLWGSVASNLPSSEGRPIFDALNDGLMAKVIQPLATPPLYAFNGKNDVTVGWAEKVAFYHDMQDARQSGCYFWDLRDHVGSPTAPWAPTQDAKYLYRFRTNLSFPALSNCSADDDPGNGSLASGDSVGTINGFVEWDTVLVDQPQDWETTLRLRTLTLLTGDRVPPESLTVDVTPRRTQAFHPAPGGLCSFRVNRVSDGATIQVGTVTVDSLSRATVGTVKVYRGGSRLHLQYLGVLGADAIEPAPRVLDIALSRNPIRGAAELAVSWPRAGRGTVELLDVAGRRVRTVWSGPVAPATQRYPLDGARLPAGLYFVVARDGPERKVRRAVVVH